VALLSVADALERILAHAAPLAAEEAPLADADGRVLANDLKALRTQPPADVSAMDGYAVRAADVERVPATLKIVAKSRPAPGSAARSAPARRRASSPAPRCPPAPTRS